MKKVRCCETMAYWYDQLWNQRNPEPIETVLADDFVLHGHGGEKITKQGYRAFFDAICQGFREIHLEVVDQIEEGDRCAMRLALTATLNSTGKKAEFQMQAFIRFDDEGRAVEAWDTVDWYGYLTRVDALPADTLNLVIEEGKTFTAL
ncbi:ester cyclase [Acanthopleuribacter pedis]|uniref:Ester cyclase n=1 Tax=Acanthopleuribacter pedis TaxID=442870 RepID=A0A8J7QG46_9BACT|nr:ester cyclase [Acanthopleuribacter pedis]MBO1319400.1 ester cyclase [Acanthopleuribacter pedis]